MEASVLAYAVTAFTTLVAIVDPPGAVPIFISMTGADTPAQKRRAAMRASVTAALALAIFAAGGNALLHFFGISMPAFRIAGGMLLFLVAIDMLRAQPSRQRTSPEEEQEGLEKPDVSIFPLAFPMLAGPGSITSVMLLMDKAQDVASRVALFVVIAVVAVLTLVTLLGATVAEKKLGRTGLNVLNRVMGLLLAAIAVQFVLDGWRAV